MSPTNYATAADTNWSADTSSVNYVYCSTFLGVPLLLFLDVRMKEWQAEDPLLAIVLILPPTGGGAWASFNPDI